MSVFTDIPEDRVLYRGDHFFIMEDGYPVSPGHLLIISNRETTDYFALSEEEKADLPRMIDLGKEIILKQHRPDGFNIGMNCGTAAGQTVMHFHCHLIPRYAGDMEVPRGGVRHCVAGKGYY